MSTDRGGKHWDLASARGLIALAGRAQREEGRGWRTLSGHRADAERWFGLSGHLPSLEAT